MTETLTLDGFTLTIATLIAATHSHHVQVSLSATALEKAQKAHAIVQAAVHGDALIYGLNTGVGQNKDKKIAPDQMADFNRDLIYSHLVAVGDNVSELVARATLIIKLNAYLRACSGVSLELIELLKVLVEKNITPVMKKTSSLGESDLGTLAFVGLVVIGEGEVYYQGVIRKTADVFAALAIEPLKLGAKEGLSIVSSNAYSQAQAAFVSYQSHQFVDQLEQIYALSMEGFDANSNLLVQSHPRTTRFTGLARTTENVLKHLENSYLLDGHKRTYIQDPLSFRNFTSVAGAFRDNLTYFSRHVTESLQVSDENPYVDHTSEQIYSTANYDTTALALAAQLLSSSYVQLARLSAFRIFKLADSQVTGLPRFLAANEQMLGFQTVQKTVATLDVTIQDLASPIAQNFYAISSGVEDYATNLPEILQKIEAILEQFSYLSAIELIHSTQAIDLRKLTTENLQLGKKTQVLYDKVRVLSPFFDHDRNISLDITLLKKELYEPII
ncbi:histidine ammonia-lyase [Lactococcus insecticola]|uniref:Histidine ammonia-lyase n=2 Tax=Pseudolactococcus insecticola TaxID=2709158 RepID=A0A6A0B6S5_9LACT|nr:histidine ammonia-lyase [Lactococcus insecticola]